MHMYFQNHSAHVESVWSFWINGLPTDALTIGQATRDGACRSVDYASTRGLNAFLVYNSWIERERAKWSGVGVPDNAQQSTRCSLPRIYAAGI